ncbi:murein L,D-transpeptidase [Nocardioides sp. CBS4Y-1]|uniref:Murein L,D-transpeptidase n=2 Tax=Nocardioides acrostichi TaxID=2784339 RepID=A0A930V4L0_9ACTN|nr:murein L,D-transpeptidase [Nocardioides acrostichi]
MVALALGVGYGVQHVGRDVAAAEPATEVTDAAQTPSAAPTSTPTPDVSPTPKPTPKPTSKPTPTQTPTSEPSPTMTPGPALMKQGRSGDDVRELQARLKQIGWFSAGLTDYYGPITAESVRGFQAKREIPVTGEVDQRTLDRLHAMTHEPTEAELHPAPGGAVNTPGALDARCTTGRAICIDKTSRTVRWVVDGSTRITLDARFGASYSPTREGLFQVQRMDADHVSNLYGSAMPYSMFFSGGQAVHFSSDFAARGYAGASHGCVNIRDLDGIKQVFGQVHVGDKVVVYWS